MKKNKLTAVVSPLPEIEAPSNPLRIDLGCGQSKREGFVGVDYVKTAATDIVADLFKVPWSWADNTADELHASHFVEHIPYALKGDERDGLIVFMDEAWRILKVGGKFTVIAPYYATHRCWQDPTHRRAICEQTFLYFNREWRVQNKLDHYLIKSDFDFSYGYAVDPAWASRSEESRAFALRHYINSISDIHVTLTKRGL